MSDDDAYAVNNDSSQERLLELAQLWYERGCFNEARELYEAAQLVAETRGDLRTEARAWTQVGRSSSLECEPKYAEQAFARAARCYEALGDSASALKARLRQAFLAYDAGDLESAERVLDQVAREERPDASVLGLTLGYRGNIARSRSALSEARQAYASAVQILSDAEDWLYAATFAMDDGIAALLLSRPSEADRALSQARAFAERGPKEPMLAPLLVHYQAFAHLMLRDVESAASCLEDFAAPDTVAMGFLAETHVLLRSLAETHTPVAQVSAVDVLHRRCPPHEHARITVHLMRMLIGGSPSRDDTLVVDVARRHVVLTGRPGAEVPPSHRRVEHPARPGQGCT